AKKFDSPTFSVHVGLDTIKVRSQYLWRLLESPCKGNVTRHEDGRHTVRIHKYSYEALLAYGQYLHEDRVDCRPEVAVELLELAEEYVDSTGLAEKCAQLVRRAATAGSLAQCVSSCLFLHRSALAVEVTKLRLCVDNACDIMQVVDACDLNDPQAQYIQDIVMNFAAGNATAIVKSERFSSLDDALKSRLFVKLASMGLLKT
ncbi:Rcbtb1, partial [Symbiodinium microadriaticum]